MRTITGLVRRTNKNYAEEIKRIKKELRNEYKRSYDQSKPDAGFNLIFKG